MSLSLQFRTTLRLCELGSNGQVQREGEVIHVVAQRLEDLLGLLASVGARDDVSSVYRTGRGDEARHGGSPDMLGVSPLGREPRDIFHPGPATGVCDLPPAG